MQDVIFVEDSFYIRFLCLSGAISLMFLAIVVFVQAYYSMRQTNASELYFRTMADNLREAMNREREEGEYWKKKCRLLEVEVERNKIEIQKLKDADDTST